MDNQSTPADIIIDILVKLPDLPTLYTVVTSNKRIYNIFNSRRILCLDRVYGNTVYTSFERMIHQKRRIPLFYPSLLEPFAEEIKKLQTFGQRPKLRSLDALALQRSTWRLLISFKVPLWHFVALGGTLVSLCQTSSYTDLIPKMAEDVLPLLLTTEFPAMSPFDRRRYEQANFIERLAKACCREGWSSNAIRLLFSFSLSEGFRSDLTTVPTLLKLLKKNPGTAYETELLKELSLRYDLNRREHASLPGHDRLTHSNFRSGLTFTSECYLHYVYLELDKTDDAVALLNGALRNLSDSTNTATLKRVISMARRTIKVLKQAQQNQQVLDIRRAIFDSLRTMGIVHLGVSVLVVWANEYATEAYRFGLPRLAIIIKEQLIWSLPASSHDSHTVFCYQLARKALLKAYQEIGIPQSKWIGQITELVVEQGDDTEGYPAAHYRMVNTDIPIMTYVAAGHVRSGGGY